MTATVLGWLLARGGGGHGGGGGGGGGGHFGGGGYSGGGSGGRGYSSGGSHFFFFGGGGGGDGGGGSGGDGLIALILIIAIVLLIWWGVRAFKRSTSVSAWPDYSSAGPAGTGSRGYGGGSQGAAFPGTDQTIGGGNLAAGIAQIQAHDPDFNQDAFLSRVSRVFFIVQKAWTDRDMQEGRQVMADALWQQWKMQIDQYLSNHTRNVLDDLMLAKASIISAHSDNAYDTIMVNVRAGCADFDINVDTNRIVRGNRAVETWQENWLFQRSSKATTKAGGGTLGGHCPNCGAPIETDLQGICAFCRAPIMSGEYDWVLTRIDQV